MAKAPKIDSVELAQFILARLGGMPHLKLQKLIYYVEAWHLAIFEESIIDDKFKAWMHGPVSTKVWHAFKDKSSPLMNDIRISRKVADAIIPKVRKSLNREQLSLIENVLEEYGDLTGYELEGLTHFEAPWREARRGIPDDESSTNEISKATMLAFYRKRLYGTRGTIAKI
jgi:uncharacterized phage-associated protein